MDASVGPTAPAPRSQPPGAWRALVRPFAAYAHWLHTRWPANRPETLPVVAEDGSTNVPGLYVVGDLSGIPLLKLSANAGTRIVRRVARELGSRRAPSDDGTLDVAIVGGGTSGFAAALEAERQGLRYVVFEASEPFSTLVNFPKQKPIYKYPTELALEGDLAFHDKSDVKEGLIEDLLEQTVDRGTAWVHARVSHVERRGGAFEIVCPAGIAHPAGTRRGDLDRIVGHERVRARRVVVAIGRSGNHRKLGIPGEDLPKVYNRLHDPADYRDQAVLVVGGGDSALETSIALAMSGADVTLSYRRSDFQRPKPDNLDKITALATDPGARAEIDQPTDPRASTSVGTWMGGQRRGRLRLALSTRVTAIRDDAVDLEGQDGLGQTLPNHSVFVMLGREAPLEFFKRSGVRILGERTATWWVSLVAFLAACVWLYHWKKTGVHIAGVPPFSWIAHIGDGWAARGWFPYGVPAWWGSLGGAFDRPAHLLGTLKISLGEPGFYYSTAYCLCVVLFGIDRLRRRRTPYVRWQTLTLMVVQCVPLFVLPYLLLPWLGNNGWFDGGLGKTVADSLFPLADYGHGREYWRAFGLILAWPLFFWNVFTEQPLWGWLAISAMQTLVLIPALIWFWGKGAYCGWICSCGALAETLGDRHRHKMPHGQFWNACNMIGQVFLVFAILLLAFHVAGWVLGPHSFPARAFGYLFHDLPLFNYVWFVDLFWAGILGVGLYFWFSGRVWCRFACPLAALMHVYTRFSRFRILADKKKCISCNVCTGVCHQGIDIMSFANKGEPMADPQCVRCSACVAACPTGVLSFGRVNARGVPVAQDPEWLAASSIRMAEDSQT